MRFLACTLGRAGFAYPLVGIARELSARGHDVVFVSEARFAETLTRHGVRCSADAGSTESLFVASALAQPRPILKDYEYLKRAVELLRPDAILTHALCHAPLLLRDVVSIPLGIVGMACYLWPGPGEDAGDARAPEYEYRSRLVRDEAALLNLLRQKLDLPVVDIVDRVARGDDGDSDEQTTLAERAGLLGDAFFLRSVASLQAAQPRPGGVHLVGDCLWEPAMDDDEAWRAAAVHARASENPVVHVQLPGKGKGVPFLSPLLEAAADVPVSLVVTGYGSEQVGPPPPHVDVYAGEAQLFAFRRAHAAITLGQSTSLLGGLSNGLPTVVVPGGGETIVNAAVVEDARCGLRIPPAAVGPGAFRAALSRVLDDAVLVDRARMLRGEFAAFGGPAAAADLCEALGTPAGCGLTHHERKESCLTR